MSGITAALSGVNRRVTPTPTPAWADITGAGAGNHANANVTMQGYNDSITLRINVTAGADTIQYRLDSGTYTTVADEGTFSVTVGQTLNWRVQSGGAETTSWQIINQSDNNTILDTIIATIS